MDLNILAVAVVGPMSALLLAWLTGRQLRAGKEQDWERQDLVAAKAKKAADEATAAANLVALQASEAASLLLAENKKTAAAAIETNGKLETIHTLVNSQMTAAIQAELDATVLYLAMVNEVLCLQKLAGHEPGVDTLASLDKAQLKIAALTKTLEERHEADRIVQEQQAATKAKLETL